MSGEVAIVTGATGALGEAAARGLARLGWSVVLGCRDEARGSLTGSRIAASAPDSEIVVLPLDLSSPKSIRGMVASFGARHNRLDALIHAAAIFSSSRRVTPEGWEMMFATNHLGPYFLTRLLMDKQGRIAPRRVLVVTAPSTTHVAFDDLQGEGRFRALWAFGASKMCNLLFTYALARRIEGTGVTANAFHPGLVKSNLMREAPAAMRFLTNMASRAPDNAASGLVALATSPKYAGISGKFFKGEQEIQSNAYSLVLANQDRLWAISSRLLDITP